MKKTATWTQFLFLIMFLLNGIAHAQILYGMKHLGFPSNTGLVSLDVTNGNIISAEYYPAFYDFYFSSAAYDHKTNTLYSWDSYTDSLCSINTTTGKSTPIGGGGILPEHTSITCLSINPITSEMFALDWWGNLFQVDKTNGSRIHIGNPEALEHVHGLAFSPNGVLYCSDTTGKDSHLFTLDTETAEVTFIADIPKDYVISLAFDVNGDLYGTDNGTDMLGIIDIETGEWTDVGALDNAMQGIAFGPVPEPCTLLLLGLGGLLIRKR